jgi:hypothetical protein
MNDGDWSEVKVKEINTNTGKVLLSNGFQFTHKEWYEYFVNFWDNKIRGKAIVPIFYEYLFAKGGSNAHEQLMKGQKHEGFLLGSMDKTLTPAQKWAIGSVVTIIFVIIIAFVILKQQGLLPGFG